jgi:hypothetical protein
MARQGENQNPPSYTSQTPVFYENKSLKKETAAHANTEDSSAIRGANKTRVSKESRKTGRK